MMEYRSTVNLPGCRLGRTAWFDETPRTAILVQQGILLPVTKSIGVEDPTPVEPVTGTWDDPPPFTMTPTVDAAPPTVPQGALVDVFGDDDTPESAESNTAPGSDAEQEALERYAAALERGLSDTEAREEGWPTG